RLALAALAYGPRSARSCQPMTPSEAEEQDERRRVALQDADVRKRQEGTMLGFAQEETLERGRFSAVGRPVIIGSAPAVASAYPAASPALQVELPPEPPLGFENPELEPPTSLAQALPDSVPDAAASSNPPLSPDSAQRGPSRGLSQKDQDNGWEIET